MAMDIECLLEDLIFKLSASASTIEKFPKLCIDLAEEKLKRTQMWVLNVRNGRRRTKSADEYFKPSTVCDQLKRSFLKPQLVTKDDIDAVADKFSKVHIYGSEGDSGNISNIGDLQATLTQSSGGSLLCRRFSTNSIRSLEDHFLAYPNHLKWIESLKKKDKQEVKSKLEAQSNISSRKTSVLSTQKEKEVRPSEIRKPPVVQHVPKEHPPQILEFCTFRSKSLFPSKEELLASDSPSLKCNKIRGHYPSVTDYLDTHFHLLREDFLQPLRDGIEEYKIMMRGRRFPPKEVQNMYLYHDVKICGFDIEQNQIGVCALLTGKHKALIKEKSFMFGSLVLLTRNDFSDVLLGTVISLEKTDKSSKKLVIKLHDHSQLDSSLRNGKFILAESKAFFQSYYYAMKVLQNMRSVDFPLKNVILQPSQVSDRPSYLSRDAEYILSHGRSVKLLDDFTWPSASSLELNDSQLTAMKAALREQVVVIQGPPGTGKTYVGTRIVKTLLNNHKIWNPLGEQPMLIICQTNHALDQFMESLLETTNNVIRVGSQSKSEVLQDFTLKRVKGRAAAGELGDKIRREFFNLKSKLPNLTARERNMQNCNVNVSNVTSYGIVHLDSLLKSNVIDRNHKFCFETPKEMLMWLEEPRQYEDFCDKENSNELITNCDNAFSFATNCSHHSDESVTKKPFSRTATFPSKFSSANHTDVKYILTLESLREDLEDRQILEEYWEQEGFPDWNNEETSEEIEDRLKYFQLNLTRKGNRKETFENVKCVWDLSPSSRWNLYKKWVDRLRAKLQSMLYRMEEDYLETSAVYQSVADQENLAILKTAKVVGMTSSAAVRLHPVLCDLKSPIVVVEEAAEVFESHIIAALSKHCQHLLLLGDHKQLRPLPASYTVSKKYQFDVSLFERLLLNGVNAQVLLTQHRMRPEISALIRNIVYPKLIDHECTLDRPDVRGLGKNVFFFTHDWNESRNHANASYYNSKEVDMVIELVRYLLKQCYAPEKICVLVMYKQQLRELEKRKSCCSTLEEIRMTSVDNFQGEESDIIILSLVRNNARNNIGFLAVENRVCVALSRAKSGLYILGNSDLMSGNSDLWTHVRTVLKKDDAVGQILPLRCDRHPHQKMSVSDPSHFERYKEGGCDLPCLEQLSCKHICPRNCHPDDRDHEKRKCVEPCKKSCSLGHPCKLLCCEPCGPCKAQVERELPCGHSASVDCSQSMKSYKCKAATIKIMRPCLHVVTLSCWEHAVKDLACPSECGQLLKCGHECKIQCHPNNVELHQKESKCLEIVTTMKKCGHIFEGCCSERYQTCHAKVSIQLLCGHTKEVYCYDQSAVHVCQAPCQRYLNCGHKCSKICGLSCNTDCEELVQSSFALECGHRPNVFCHQRNSKIPASEASDLLRKCPSPCSAILACGHKCLGSCGECSQGQFHVPCKKLCDRTLICGHKCKALCLLGCPPCTAKCDMKCGHGKKCKRRCGQKCTPCHKPCLRKCEHRSCSRRCSEPCDVQSCHEGCKRVLSCGHQCSGFCGEPCPSICSVCNDLPKLSKWRLVVFSDCQCIAVAPTMLEKALLCLKGKSHTPLSEVIPEIHMPECPLCQKPVLNTFRYRELVTYFKGLHEKVHGIIFQEVQRLRLDVRGVQRSLKWTTITEMPVHTGLKSLLIEQLSRATKSKFHSFKMLATYIISLIFLECVKYANDAVKKVGITERSRLQEYLKQIFGHLTSCVGRALTQQELVDLRMNVQRLKRRFELTIASGNPNMPAGFQNHCRQMLMALSGSDAHQNHIWKEMLNLYDLPSLVPPKEFKPRTLEGASHGTLFHCSKGHIFTKPNEENENVSLFQSNPECESCSSVLKSIQ